MIGTFRLAVAVGVAGAALLTVAMHRPQTVPLGFSRARAQAQTEIERRFLAAPDAARIEGAHKFLTEQPHMAGSARDRALAEWMSETFRSAGLENVAMETHEVLLPWPQEVSVEMTSPRPWRASMRERSVASDPFTSEAHANPGVPFHAYSASGDVTAPVVYAGSGLPGDYDWLASQGIDVRGKIVIVRYSVPYSYRGFKVYTAERHGAAGILIYSDPADDGYAKGKTYPDGPWSPESRIERGGIAYDFLVPGDPLTPGWASLTDAPRIDSRNAVSLPRIVSAPLSFEDARVILESLGGPAVPARWRGAGRLTYRAGPGDTVVRLRVKSDDRVRPIWTVTGMIRGSAEPDDVVIVGNHRDAWIYGGVDPSSGTAALVELARTLGELARSGWRPRRTILFASWDAEEFALTSSTEWGEQHQEWLRNHAVAYLNVDSAASGPNLSLSAVPALNQVLDDAARVVRDPVSRLTLAAATRDRQRRDTGTAPAGTTDDLVNNQIGGGSDYTVFLNHLGIPILDASFEGPYGVYHSIYDNHAWVARIGDPGFRYHTTLVQLLGLVTLRLASADIVPLDYEPYARRIESFLVELERQWFSRPMPDASASLADVRTAAAEMRVAARRFNGRRDDALERADSTALPRFNRQLRAAERALLDPEGLPGRSWYRHAIYAPGFTYAPVLLPGVAEAVDALDVDRARTQSDRLSAALRRAAHALGAPE